MNSKSIQNLILQCDLLGPTPTLTIFKDNRYKSLKSAIISILGILGIIAFSVYSIYDFFMFNNPSIIYFKDNTQAKKITVNLNDILFMFRLNEDDSKIQFGGQLIYEDGKSKQIRFEKCGFGKNIDNKHKELITKFENASEQKHSNYYCISKNDSNITISYDKLEGENYIMITIFGPNSSNSSPSDSYNGKYISYVIQSDSINHFDRNNPLKKDYVIGNTEVLTDSEIIYPVIFLNYIEYETDNGAFFSNNKIYKGIEFSNQQDKLPKNYVNSLKNYVNLIPNDVNKSLRALDFNDSIEIHVNQEIIHFENPIEIESRNGSESRNGIDVIGIMFLRINGQFLERYKRIYPKLQSLIADIISTIQLILLIYEFLTNNLYSNKVRVEIIKSILKDYDDGEMKINLEKEDKENTKAELIKVVNNNKNYKENIIIENIIPKKKIILPKITNLRVNIQSSNRLITQNIDKGKIINKKNNHDMLLEKMNKINFCNFLLYEFSCCCQKKSKINKIIEKCNELIDKEASFDNIIYKMLKIDNKKEQKIFENNEIKEIIKILNET